LTPPRRDEALEAYLKRAAAPVDHPAGEDCLDAETAAAWVDNGLDAGTRSALEPHVADCARCQALLATLLATDQRAAEAPATAVEPRRSWRMWLVPLAAAAVLVIAAGVWTMRLRKPEPPPQQMAASQETAAAAQPGPGVPGAALRREAPAPQRRPEPPSTASPESARRPEASRGDSPEPAAKARTADAGAQSETRQTAPAALADQTSGFTALAADIRSPDPSIRWRIRGGLVERSTDAGRTWTAAATGQVPGLVAGSAPSPTVCWIVGRAGVVLVTGDGTSWARRQVDPPVDLSGVAATDASVATVTAANGQSFATADGGLTWTADSR
jgi:outer membrane biosynthesis protein TonB